LHWAVLAGNTEVVRELLKRPEMNLRITNRPDMQTAYDVAIAMHNDAIVDLLNRRRHVGTSKDELSLNDVYEPHPIEEAVTVAKIPGIAHTSSDKYADKPPSVVKPDG